MVYLEHWHLRGQFTEFMMGLDDGKAYLYGRVSGHNNQPDGTVVQTSAIIELNLNSRVAVTKSGTEYHLGAMEPQYEAWVKQHAAD